ncbi:hypothetical protein O181_082470 [Austropuccinia psidii MF-1]|uniref:Uncharacterized protein n=1 Tax=Austropuccinia psidii MF-1 TaxID=1389203 RepID=A0A9Q3IKW0_9BASI|nr:hypothetical protein [Austropuccinia psidii MF-1]
MLSDKHTRNAHLLSEPSNHAARGVPDEDALVRTPLWLTMMKAFPSGNGRWDPKQADGYDSGRLYQSPQDGDGKRTFKLGPIVTMGFKCQKQKQPNPLQQDSPVPSLPHKQTPRKPTPGSSGT